MVNFSLEGKVALVTGASVLQLQQVLHRLVQKLYSTTSSRNW
jgi:hypothetical protein